ncbi:MAG: hypothetical protein LBH29_06310 [Elusimicrobiota bacterium]|nr:hypothetical protein [Elusimicrobiota bacterium]
MNKNLEEIIKIYSAQSHLEFNKTLLSYSKDTLISIFSDLLTMYINDKNSSTIREFITVSMAGYKHNIKKIGFNGFKQDSIGNAINCEAKPKNFSTQDFIDYKNRLKKTKPANLNGGGNFTDYRWDRYERDKKSSVNMLVSGFIDGQLVYILEFPFNEKSFMERIEQQLKKKFPNGDIKGEWLRSVDFNFSHYKDAENLKIIFALSSGKLKPFENYIRRDLYEYLAKGGL